MKECYVIVPNSALDAIQNDGHHFGEQLVGRAVTYRMPGERHSRIGAAVFCKSKDTVELCLEAARGAGQLDVLIKSKRGMYTTAAIYFRKEFTPALRNITEHSGGGVSQFPKEDRAWGWVHFHATEKYHHICPEGMEPAGAIQDQMYSRGMEPELFMQPPMEQAVYSVYGGACA